MDRILGKAKSLAAQLAHQYLPVSQRIAYVGGERAHSISKGLQIACIMDNFTYHSFVPEADFYQLTPEHWQEELEACTPEMLFIESAWRGKDDLWGSKVGHKSSEVQGVIAWCNQRDIPTVFWNKEDPVHFETFLNTAKLFDHVFTTDLDCIHRYKAALGHESVYFLPFACQPSLTNPVETYDRKDAFCFAGAYYVRYPDRIKDLEAFVKEFPKFKPLEIYDRNFGKDDPNYQFPESYQPYIVGTLPFSEIDKAYKGYRYAINLNSIKQSQTMFARRVYELLGSNTITVSNFSRGIRLLFGELVLTSDSGAEIVRRLQALESDPKNADKFRLAGLRKVLSEHTYQARLDYILSKVTGKHQEHPLPGYTVVSLVNNVQDLSYTLANVVRQRKLPCKLLVVTREGISTTEAQARLSQLTEGITGHCQSLANLEGKVLTSLAEPRTWLAAFSPSDYYGPNYLLDLALATRFSTAPVIGKAAYYEATKKSLHLRHSEQAYRAGAELPVRAAALSPAMQKDQATAWVMGIEAATYTTNNQQATDAFNYCREALACQAEQSVKALAAVQATVDDAVFDRGMPLVELERLGENTPPAPNSTERAPCFTAEELHEIFASPGTDSSKMTLTQEGIEVSSTLGDGKHEYLYPKGGDNLSLDELAQGQLKNGKLPLHLEMTPGLHLTFVIIFFDTKKKRLHHYIVPPNKNNVLEIPEGAARVRLGFRVYQGGKSVVKRLLIGGKDLSPPNVIGCNDVLLLTNNYPSYDDLYKNGFVHSRVKAYRQYGQDVDVFRFKKDRPLGWHEFQDIDVITGSQTALENMLATGRYRHVLVHFLDRDMWDVLNKFIERIKVNAWVHGAEIHPWYRRKYNIQTQAQEDAAKAVSEKRMAFWRSTLKPMPPNLSLVFVSNHFAGEVMEDLGFELPKKQYSVIHNPIDTDLFNYVEKPKEQRKKILSIRPFASRQYANDLTVAAILELSKKPYFNELEFCLIGDGPLFDETVKPIRGFSNVTLEKRFIAQPEIARLHKKYGVFMCPTRWDSQGVSRDEAMSSGLVPVTNSIAAIPEFVDDSCGVLAPVEDAEALVQGIEALYGVPDRFQSLSTSAARRVRTQSEKSRIIEHELQLFSSDSKTTQT